jgi:hypothetical protein
VDIVFVVMPFADLGRPAIGVSLLKAAALQAGYTARIEYCNIRLADEIGGDLYQQISSSVPPDLVLGEWFFADDLFGDEIPHADQYLAGPLARNATEELAMQVLQSRACVSKYLDECARRIAAERPRVVGFTTTFHQTIERPSRTAADRVWWRELRRRNGIAVAPVVSMDRLRLLW